jgi:RNA polymerase sigma-70 factor (ECF subfamily)
MDFDVALIGEMKNGKQSAFSTCYKQLSPIIYSTVLRICHCKSSAQDILQETFIQVFKSINTLEDNEKFVAWLKRISYYKTINWIRSNDKHLLDINLELVEEPIDNNDLQLAIENNHQLTKLMLGIPPEARLILWLFIVDGYSHQEIADMYGKSVSFSKSVVSRALKTLSIEGAHYYK